MSVRQTAPGCRPTRTEDSAMSALHRDLPLGLSKCISTVNDEKRQRGNRRELRSKERCEKG